MPLNQNYLCVFDFETGSRYARTTEPIELAAVMIHPRKLEIVEGSEFESYIRPYDINNCEEGALAVGGKSKAQVEELKEKLAVAPERKTVFENFTAYLKRYAVGTNQWGYPIPCGHNIIGFDNLIIYRLCEEFKRLDKNGNQLIFHPMMNVDTINLCFGWFENMSNPGKLSMDTLRPFFGLPNDGGHRALFDVKGTAAILIQFLKYQRRQALKTKFEGALAGERV